MVENVNMFELFSKRMDWLGQRQAVISNNIANADTPKYVAKDLRQDDFRKLLLHQSGPRLEASLTRDGHMRPAGTSQNAMRAVDSPDTYETSASGNSVVIEEQMVKMNLINVDYGLVVGLYKKHLSMLKMALKSSG